MDCHLVFVYGTLKRGQPNEYFLNLPEHTARFRGQAQTQKTFPLVIGSQWNFPLLLNAEGKGKHVMGEIYEVDDVTLKALDDFEGHPNLYVRQTVAVRLLNTTDSGGEAVKCWTYFFVDCQQQHLALPCLDVYDSQGDHGLEYNTEEDVYDVKDL